MDKIKRPTLAELLESQETLRKDKARAKALYRGELSNLKAPDIDAISEVHAGEYPYWSVSAAKSRPHGLSR